MDIQDFDSPLRGLLSSPVKRITPAVPVPDWLNSSPGRPIPSPVIGRVSGSSLLAKDKIPRLSCIQAGSSLSPSDPNALRSSVINSSLTSKISVNNENINSEFKNSVFSRTSVSNTSLSALDSSNNICDTSNVNSERLPQTPSHRISGDIAFTPTHSAFTPSHGSQNPHATLAAQTPIASGPDQAKNSIKLQNCVSTVNLCCELKLLDIYCRTRFSEYNPSRFHGVVMRILEPRATALVFRSGKLVCTGAKNEHDSLLAARKFSRIIQKLGYPVQFTEFKIQNFVATADLRFPVRLEALQQAHGQFTSYEPELFPGLVYRLVRPRIVLLIFVNGKIVFTGGKSRNDIVESLNIIYPILRSFKKN